MSAPHALYKKAHNCRTAFPTPEKPIRKNSYGKGREKREILFSVLLRVYVFNIRFRGPFTNIAHIICGFFILNFEMNIWINIWSMRLLKILYWFQTNCLLKKWCRVVFGSYRFLFRDIVKVFCLPIHLLTWYLYLYRMESVHCVTLL